MATDHVTQGRRNKAAGYRSEKKGEERLSRFGFHRVTMSGAIEGEPGDLRRDIPDGRALRMLENKRRKGGMGYVYTWLAQEGCDGVRFDPGGRQKPLYILPEDVFLRVLEEAGYDPDTQAVKSLPDLLRLAATELERT